jgi:hypothetical protein
MPAAKAHDPGVEGAPASPTRTRWGEEGRTGLASKVDEAVVREEREEGESMEWRMAEERVGNDGFGCETGVEEAGRGSGVVVVEVNEQEEVGHRKIGVGIGRTVGFEEGRKVVAAVAEVEAERKATSG